MAARYVFCLSLYFTKFFICLRTVVPSISSLGQPYNCNVTNNKSAMLVPVERQGDRLTLAASELHDTDVNTTPGYVQLFVCTELQGVFKRLCRTNTGNSMSGKCLTSKSTALRMKHTCCSPFQPQSIEAISQVALAQLQT